MPSHLNLRRRLTLLIRRANDFGTNQRYLFPWPIGVQSSHAIPLANLDKCGHPAIHMHGFVAVKHPVAWIGGDDLKVDRPHHRWHVDRILDQWRLQRLAAETEQAERLPVQVKRVRLHAHIRQAHREQLVTLGNKRVSLGVDFAVDRPDIRVPTHHHAAGQGELVCCAAPARLRQPVHPVPQAIRPHAQPWRKIRQLGLGRRFGSLVHDERLQAALGVGLIEGIQRPAARMVSHEDHIVALRRDDRQRVDLYRLLEWISVGMGDLQRVSRQAQHKRLHVAGVDQTQPDALSLPDHQRRRQAQVQLPRRVGMRVIPARAGRASVEFVGEGRTRLDRGLAEIRHAIHRGGHIHTVPVDRSRFRKTVREGHSHIVALAHPNRVSWHRAVVGPGSDALARREFPAGFLGGQRDLDRWPTRTRGRSRWSRPGGASRGGCEKGGTGEFEKGAPGQQIVAGVLWSAPMLFLHSRLLHLFSLCAGATWKRKAIAGLHGHFRISPTKVSSCLPFIAPIWRWTITPFRSMKKLIGNTGRRYASRATAPVSSRSTGKGMWNSLTNACASGSESSNVMLIASTTRPSALWASYARTISGISARQGSHQLAQKLISTGWPWNFDSVTVLPSSVFKVKSGAG